MANKPYSKTTPGSITGVCTRKINGASQPESRVQYNWINSLSGEKKPNWKRLIQAGSDATTPMSATETSCDHTDGYLYRKLRRKADGAIAEGFSQGWVLRGSAALITNNPTALPTSNASRDASSKWYSRARAAQSQLQAGVLIGELRETLGMIAGRGAFFKRLLTDWRSVYRQARRLTRRQALKALSDAYLEMQFGWKPLVSDIEGALKAFRDPRLEITRVSASAKEESASSPVRTHSLGDFPFTFYSDFTLTGSTTVKIRGGVKVMTTGTGRRRQSLGLLPQDFVPTVYELVPWSFLVDYFTDLGNVLAALTFPREDIAWASTTTVREYIGTYLTAGFEPVPAAYEEKNATFIPQVVRWRKKAVTRSVGVPTLPTVTIRLPDSGWRWANMLALAVSRDFAHLRI